MADGRGRETLDTFFDSFSWEERAQVESVAMDMWPAYIASVGSKIPGARDKIAYDKFHVAQHLSQAVDKVRRQENQTLLAEGDEQLKGTKYLWLSAFLSAQRGRAASLQAAAGQCTEDGSRLGDQGTGDESVELSDTGLGAARLARLVPVGDSLASGANPEGRRHDQTASARHPQCHRFRCH